MPKWCMWYGLMYEWVKTKSASHCQYSVTRAQGHNHSIKPGHLGLNLLSKRTHIQMCTCMNSTSVHPRQGTNEVSALNPSGEFGLRTSQSPTSLSEDWYHFPLVWTKGLCKAPCPCLIALNKFKVNWTLYPNVTNPNMPTNKQLGPNLENPHNSS